MPTKKTSSPKKKVVPKKTTAQMLKESKNHIKSAAFIKKNGGKIAGGLATLLALGGAAYAYKNRSVKSNTPAQNLVTQIAKTEDPDKIKKIAKDSGVTITKKDAQTLADTKTPNKAAIAMSGSGTSPSLSFLGNINKERYEEPTQNDIKALADAKTPEEVQKVVNDAGLPPIEPSIVPDVVNAKTTKTVLTLLNIPPPSPGIGQAPIFRASQSIAQKSAPVKLSTSFLGAINNLGYDELKGKITGMKLKPVTTNKDRRPKSAPSGLYDSLLAARRKAVNGDSDNENSDSDNENSESDNDDVWNKK